MYTDYLLSFILKPFIFLPIYFFFLGLHKSIMHVHCTYYISFSMYIELPVTSKQFATDLHYHFFDIIQLHSL